MWIFIKLVMRNVQRISNGYGPCEKDSVWLVGGRNSFAKWCIEGSGSGSVRFLAIPSVNLDVINYIRLEETGDVPGLHHQMGR